MTDPTLEALSGLGAALGLSAATLESVHFTGTDPVLPSPYRVATAGAAALAASAAAAAELWLCREGRPQRIDVDLRHAAASLRSGRYFRIDGKPGPAAFDGISDYYPVKDGGWVFAQNNAPHHRAAFFSVLGCEADKAAAQTASRLWDGQALEDALHAGGAVAGMVRSPEQWRNHPQGLAVAAQPLVTIRRIGDAPARTLPPAARPLAGLRVLDLTRVIAGPIAARTLASHGADVLRISAAHLADIGLAELETGIGKLATRLDLRDDAARTALDALIGEADVFLQGYRPGGLANLGYSPEAVARVRPGIVYANLSAWGGNGPWAARRGFDSVVQAVSGMALTTGGGVQPRMMAMSAIDYVTGYLLAAAITVALKRQAEEGGSWLVDVSLARAGHWITGLGTVPAAAFFGVPEDLPSELIESISVSFDAPSGRLTHLGPIVGMALTPPHWQRPAVPLGHHPPAWPLRS